MKAKFILKSNLVWIIWFSRGRNVRLAWRCFVEQSFTPRCEIKYNNRVYICVDRPCFKRLPLPHFFRKTVFTLFFLEKKISSSPLLNLEKKSWPPVSMVPAGYPRNFKPPLKNFQARFPKFYEGTVHVYRYRGRVFGRFVWKVSSPFFSQKISSPSLSPPPTNFDGPGPGTLLIMTRH